MIPKEKLSEYHDVLKNQLDEFYMADMIYKTTKNSKKRDEAERTINSVLDRFKHYVKSDFDLFSIMTVEEGTSQDKEFYWDDAYRRHNFARDLHGALEKIQNKIAEMG